MSIISVTSLLQRNLATVIMTIAVLVSGVAVVYAKHQSRVEFIALQKAEQKRDQLDEEWGRLLLEQSTWSGLGRIEQQASKKLNMIRPTAEMIVVVKQ